MNIHFEKIKEKFNAEPKNKKRLFIAIAFLVAGLMLFNISSCMKNNKKSLIENELYSVQAAIYEGQNGKRYTELTIKAKENMVIHDLAIVPKGCAIHNILLPVVIRKDKQLDIEITGPYLGTSECIVKQSVIKTQDGGAVI
ncbi:hypothetical protein [Budvicia aquatica]|uniref:Uncharacterized protein n=1 Tax=Budvicia aquatica TaxID=82979 RepID=A0A484ZH48_9GAMM|nr:hypothetical protein [Budvicia aquatica]VFS45159.1 Uncharacterised protein [Budvicia aquatica]